MKYTCLLYFIVASLLLSSTRSTAQCNITLGGSANTGITFNSSAQLQAGATSSSSITLAWNVAYGTNCPAGWSLKVRTSGSFTSGSNTIAPNYTSVQFSQATGGPSTGSVGITSSAITLSTTNQNVISSAGTALQVPPNSYYYYEYKFNFSVQGGSHLYKPSGTYTTNLIFTLFNSSGTQVSQATFAVSFTNNMNVSCAPLTLGSNSTSSSFTLDNYGKLMSGVTASNAVTLEYAIQSAMLCSGFSLKVKTSSNFISGANSIAASYMSIRYNQTTGPTATSLGMTTSALALGTSEVTLINNSSGSIETPPYYSFNQKFDLILQGGNHLVKPAGTYSTNLIFTVYNSSGAQVSQVTIPISFTNNVNVSCTPILFDNSYYNNHPTIDTYAQIMSGVTSTAGLNLHYIIPANAACTGFTLKVRATGNFTCGGSSVAASYASIRFNQTSGGPSASSLGMPSAALQLSTSDVTILSNSSALLEAPPGSFDHKFDVIIQGGTHLIKPDNGTYTTNLIFSLYDASNTLVRTQQVTVYYAYNYSGNYQFSMQLQSGFSNVGFTFNSPAAYTNGISIQQNNALTLTAYVPYQVIAKTDAANFATTSGYNLPVSVINIQATMASQPTYITVYSFALSASDQTLIRNTTGSNPAHTYNLRYYTTPNNTTLLYANKTAPYNTTVTLVAVPL
ncbi:MAG: hypothetical protein ABW019_12665 [Chitinophagaceae bacterium]